MTKIYIPIEKNENRNSIPSKHFGRAPLYYIIHDLDDSNKDRVISNSSDHFGGKGKPTPKLIKDGAEVVITTGMGRRAIEMFEKKGIKIFKTEQEAIAIILSKFQKGELEELTEKCLESRHS